MKRQLLLLLVTVSIIGFSCKKIDFPLPKKLCQIKKIVREGGPTASATFEYSYNNQRLLNQLSASFQVHLTIQFEYDSQDRLATIYNGFFTKTKLIYENDLLVRTDNFDGSDQLIQQIFFKYDNRKRLIEKNGSTGSFSLTRYEYEGHSRNLKRKLFYAPPSPAASNKGLGGATVQLEPQDQQLQIIYEYKYDNKINPQATLVGQSLSPFYFGQEMFFDAFEPIPENNIVYQKFIGRSGDVFFNYMEYFITYDYNNHYPVRENHRKIFYYVNPDVPPRESFATATYEYECRN